MGLSWEAVKISKQPLLTPNLSENGYILVCIKPGEIYNTLLFDGTSLRLLYRSETDSPIPPVPKFCFCTNGLYWVFYVGVCNSYAGFKEGV